MELAVAKEVRLPGTNTCLVCFKTFLNLHYLEVHVCFRNGERRLGNGPEKLIPERVSEVPSEDSQEDKVPPTRKQTEDKDQPPKRVCSVPGCCGGVELPECKSKAERRRIHEARMAELMREVVALGEEGLKERFEFKIPYHPYERFHRVNQVDPVPPMRVSVPGGCCGGACLEPRCCCKLEVPECKSKAIHMEIRMETMRRVEEARKAGQARWVEITSKLPKDLVMPKDLGKWMDAHFPSQVPPSKDNQEDQAPPTRVCSVPGCCGGVEGPDCKSNAIHLEKIKMALRRKREETEVRLVWMSRIAEEKRIAARTFEVLSKVNKENEVPPMYNQEDEVRTKNNKDLGKRKTALASEDEDEPWFCFRDSTRAFPDQESLTLTMHNLSFHGREKSIQKRVSEVSPKGSKYFTSLENPESYENQSTTSTARNSVL